MTLEGAIRTLKEECALQPGRLLLAGVSGGPDSLALACILNLAGFPMVIAHFNHHLRPESDADHDYVKDFSSRMGVRFISREMDVRSYAETKRLSIEEAARKARYHFLFEEARRAQAQAVAVGHTADDQVETVLMHLLRGAGLSGLRGMAYRAVLPEWDANLPLVRPLLDSWRSEIEMYCKEKKLVPLVDPTNRDPHYYRNRIRGELLPILQTYNPKIKHVLHRMARSINRDARVLDEEILDIWQWLTPDFGTGTVCMDRAAFENLQPGVKQNIVRKAILALRPDLRDIDFLTVEKVLSLEPASKKKHQIQLSAGLNWMVDGDRVLLTDSRVPPPDDHPRLVGENALRLTIPGSVNLAGGWALAGERLENIAPGDLEFNPSDNMEVVLAVEDLHFPLRVRTRKPGDRMHPLGMKGHSIKISDLFINLRIPAVARDNWPLVCSGEEIIWVPGCRLSEMHRVKATTRSVLRLLLRRQN